MTDDQLEDLREFAQSDHVKPVLLILGELQERIAEELLKVAPTAENKEQVFIAAVRTEGAKKLLQLFKQEIQSLKKA